MNVAQAKARFSELIRRAVAGEQVVIARDGEPVVRLAPLHDPPGWREPGSARGRVWLAEDFDRTPDDFADYR